LQNVPKLEYFASVLKQINWMSVNVVFLQFLLSHKLAGAVKNVVKTKTKDQLVTDYKTLFNDKVCNTSCNYVTYRDDLLFIITVYIIRAYKLIHT